MPDKDTLKRAREDKRTGKAASTQAGEFVKEEMDHIRQGQHGARSAAQAVAIGLSKARRAGVDLPAPERGRASEATRRKAKSDLAAGDEAPHAPSRKRSRATTQALQRESPAAASKTALSRQSRSAAAKRTTAERSQAAGKASRTKGPTERHAAAEKAARTRARNAAKPR
jgi:hypothetical protein